MSKRFIRKEVLEKVRTLSAFDYLKNYAPDLLVKNGRTDYYHRNHDSLHFSNGKWYWWSQGKGGTSALDYLIIVEGYEFKDACNYLSDLMNVSAPVTTFYHPKPSKPFELPVKDKNNDLVIRYLCEVRKIDKDIVDDFISKGMIYQSANFKNAVFVGYDKDKPAYAFKRSIFKNFKLDHAGSNKAFSFNYTNPKSDVLHIFEAVIDLLSYMTLLKMNEMDYTEFSYLSLAGASDKIATKSEADIPIALKTYLERNPNIKTIIFHLDNDEVGIGATSKIISILNSKYQCIDEHPTSYKDVNEELIHKKFVTIDIFLIFCWLQIILTSEFLQEALQKDEIK